jgi:hypothetical protein
VLELDDLESVASFAVGLRAHHNWARKSGYFPDFVFYME